MRELAITAVNSITAVGHDAAMTAAAVRAGIGRFSEYEEFPDREGNPVTVSRIKGIADNLNTVERINEIAALCLENLLNGYFSDGRQGPSRMRLLLGSASEERPGPRYEDSCEWALRGMIEKLTAKTSMETFPMGNASLMYAIAAASRVVEDNPDGVCIVGGVDSLLRDSTLNWFEQDGRLKSVSFGRHQGLIAGEAVCFMIVEDAARARQANRPILTRITGLGVAAKTVPSAAAVSSAGTGLTEACRAALTGRDARDIQTVLGDLNGENSRAVEWSIAEKACFGSRYPKRQLWTPSNCYGDVGAASGTVLAAVAAQGIDRGWLQGPALVFCSDEHGSCGALIMEHGWRQEV